MIIFSRELLNCKIDSHLYSLDNLNKFHKWIPSSKNIRPNDDILEEKKEYFKMIENTYNSLKDYILIELFKCNSFINHQKKLETSVDDLYYKSKIFIKNKYPYLEPSISNHYIMWYKNYTPFEEEISSDIYQNLKELLNSEEFQFVWYENPKMSINDIYHVQVFWISLLDT